MSQSRLLPMQRSPIATRIILAVFLAIFLLLLLPAAGFAQAPDRFGLDTAAETGLPQTDLRLAIVRIIQIILGFLGTIAVLLILYGGFVWMTAGGDPAKIDKAKRILINTIIGLIIIMSAYTIVFFIIRSLEGGLGAGSGRGPGGGGPDDFGRWGIGVGPIESVYPANGQVNVPINTNIIVTFKERINSQTMTMANMEICQADNRGACLEEGEFTSAAFTDSAVATTDNRTFVITPNKHLGLEDFQNRRFKVALQEGIETEAEPGESVFTGLVGREYAWQFTTNGELDLDPPEVLAVVGVYPYPDNAADVYGTAAAPSPTTFNITTISGIREETAAAVSAVTAGPGAVPATISGNYVGGSSGTVLVRIDSNTGEVITNWPEPLADFNGGAYDNGAVLNLGPYGLAFNLQGIATRGSRWTFTVTAPQAGDKLEILESDNTVATYVFGRDIAAADYVNQIAAASPVLDDCGANCLRTTATGAATARYNLNFVGQGAFQFTKTAGADQKISRQKNDNFDAYRNTIVQINFSEAINPASLNNNLIVRRAGAVVSGYTLEISNQYRTVELIGTEQCGVNSCGEAMYCWPVTGAAEEYEVEIVSATLMDVSDPRCPAWGGAGDGHGRCVKEIGGQNVYYPQAPTLNGLTDTSGNAFNGSFNSYETGGRPSGIAEGQSNEGSGHSGRPAFDLNLGLELSGGRLIGYGQSTPVYGSSGFGDNLKWSFFIANQIDNQAPLITTVLPTGDADVSKADAPVRFSFDRLMRSATLKPGWNYGPSDKEKAQRYLVLQTVGATALPVGYWVRKDDIDDNNDGWADYTAAELRHNNFDSFIKYSPLAGSGIQSATQNCFIASAGPEEAAKSGQECRYENGALAAGCADVALPNPASYGYLNCAEISGAAVCQTGQTCQTSYGEDGSWIITKDFPGGATCCFGVCVNQ